MPRTVHARDTRFGGYLEDYEVGDLFHHWPGKTVTQAENHQFCLLTMAVNPVHIDAHFAAQATADGKNLVVGSYVYALLLGMSVPDISGRAIANLGAEHLRHVAPFHPGDTLYGRTEVASVRPSKSRPAAGILTVATTGTNQDDVIVCTFTRNVLLPRRPGLPHVGAKGAGPQS
jgi:acyl dehydratase